MLTGCPSPNEGNPPSATTTGGGTAPEGGGTPPGGGDEKPGVGAAVRTLSFNLELSEPNGSPLALGSGPSLTSVTSDKGTAVIGTVSGKIYPITVRNVPQAAKAITLTVKKRGFVDTTVGPIAVPALGNPGPQVKTIAYATITTRVSGKVVTPARAADASKGSVITTARVWASTDPANKVTVDTTDGSYSLDVQTLGPRNFDITAEYTAGDGNYTTSDPQTVSSMAPTYTQDIALNYGHTTTVSGKVVTPARAADAAKGSHIPTAEVWASTDPTNKVPVNPADGSYTLNGVKHSGTFTVTAEYTATGNSNYTTSDPQNVSTTASTYTQDIALNYGYTTKFTVLANLQSSSTSLAGTISSGVTIIVEVEGREAARGQTSGSPVPQYVVDVDHPGTVIVRAPSQTVGTTAYNASSLAALSTTQPTDTRTLTLSP